MSDSYQTDRLAFWREHESDSSFATTLNNVQTSGWSAMLIGGETVGSRFAYSVGIFDTQGFPEIIVVGLPSKTAHFALQYSLKAMRAGTDLSVGRHHDIVGEVDVMFRPVAHKWYEHVMCQADRYYTNEVVPALQLIYPDTDGRFQDEPLFKEYFRQPLLQSNSNEGRTERDFWAVNDPSSSLFDWKFSDPPHTAVFLSKEVHEQNQPITFATHNRIDATWEFLGATMVQEGDLPLVSCFHHIVDNDPSVAELHDLPLGWFATRDKPCGPWRRFEEADDPDPADPTLLN